MNDELEQETGLDSMTKAELKAEARTHGLSTGGTKAALLERVQAALQPVQGHDRGAAGGDGDEESRGGTRTEAAEEEREPEPAEAEEEREPEAPAAEAEEEREPEHAEAEAEPGPEPAEAEEEPEPEPAEAEAEREPEAPAAEEEPEPTEAEEEREPEAPAAERKGGAPARDAEGVQEPSEPEAAREEPAPENRRNGHDVTTPVGLAKVASAAASALAELTGRTVDAVSGVQRNDGGYRVTIEVLELSRVPSTTDVLATYEVDVGRDGDVTSCWRTHRYYRNQTSRE
jgi:outer membrane biosynthesis protein TonB